MTPLGCVATSCSETEAVLSRAWALATGSRPPMSSPSQREERPRQTISSPCVGTTITWSSMATATGSIRRVHPGDGGSSVPLGHRKKDSTSPVVPTLFYRGVTPLLAHPASCQERRMAGRGFDNLRLVDPAAERLRDAFVAAYRPYLQARLDELGLKGTDSLPAGSRT